VLVQMLSLVHEVVVLVVGLESLQEVSLLGILPLVLNMGMVKDRYGEPERGGVNGSR
jgi:hypothetical protein